MGKINLTNNQRDSIAHFLLANSSKGIPFKGKIKEASVKWGVDRKTIWLWWTRAKEKISNEDAIHLTSLKMGNTNAPKVVINREMIRSMSVKNRGSISKLAKKLKTVQRWVKKGELRKHTNAIHPTLNDSNKLQRLLFSLTSTFVDILANKIMFKDMSNQIHIDEKWFYITKTTDSFYILSDEVPPNRSCQSKRYITKVMFMSVVSRPIYEKDGELLFDGKIGMFPFIEEQPAAWRSKKQRSRNIGYKTY
ncbi:uncharacterized protein LOC141637225 [Silene latifolia]|uniref:uncharacterized protein LOC141637225 n=1 Tax=Silene latifolia TaxID=37657 RepID=UPI003D7704B2